MDIKKNVPWSLKLWDVAGFSKLEKPKLSVKKKGFFFFNFGYCSAKEVLLLGLHDMGPLRVSVLPTARGAENVS